MGPTIGGSVLPWFVKLVNTTFTLNGNTSPKFRTGCHPRINFPLELLPITSAKFRSFLLSLVDRIPFQSRGHNGRTFEKSRIPDGSVWIHVWKWMTFTFLCPLQDWVCHFITFVLTLVPFSISFYCHRKIKEKELVTMESPEIKIQWIEKPLFHSID